MGSVLIQFHALPDELLALAKEVVNDFRLHIVAMKFFPFEAVEIDASDLVVVFSDASQYEELVLMAREPVFPASNQMDFADKNPDALHMTIERKTKSGLRQSSLAAHSVDLGVLTIWKRIAGRLKKITRAGVVAINPNTGARATCRDFRYSKGAQALADGGVPMLALAGGSLISFGASGGRR